MGPDLFDPKGEVDRSFEASTLKQLTKLNIIMYI